MASNSTAEIFNPVTRPAADWSAGSNWSGGLVPDAGMRAEIDGIVASIDPGSTIEASLRLDGGTSAAGLIGNYGAVALGEAASITVIGQADLFACDSAVNKGEIMLAGGATFDVVVDLGALSGRPGAPPPSFANDGRIDVGSAGLLEIGGTQFENRGTIAIEGGTLSVTGGALAGGGTIDLGGGALAVLGDGVTDQCVRFGADGGTLALLDPHPGPGMTIGGFGGGDQIILPELHDGTLARNGSIVSLIDHSGHVDGRFVVAGSASLAIVSGIGGSTILSSGTFTGQSGQTVTGTDYPAQCDPPCFARGTMILTPSGYRRIEGLAPGDRIITANGEAKAIVWTGLRTIDIAVHPDPVKVQPIRFAAGSIAPGIPHRPLRLSPDHSVWLDGVLIPAKCLVNGATIVQEQAVFAVTYHHLELAGHDVLLAEGLHCETYLDTGNRVGFANATSWPVRKRSWDRDAFAPLCINGPRLSAIRKRLHERTLALGFTLETRCAVELRIDELALPVQTGTWLDLPVRHSGRAVLGSARFVPACVDPGSDDRRVLGVALAGLNTEHGFISPAQAARSGFHPRSEGDEALWTDGAGEIVLLPGTRRLVLDFAGLPRTWRRHATPIPSILAEEKFK